MNGKKSDIVRRMDQLAKQYGETHDPAVQDELLLLSQRLTALEKADAIVVLENALARCRHENMRRPEVLRALDYLQQRAAEKWPFEQFLDGLSTKNEEGRWQTINASLNGIKRQVGA